MAANTSLLFLLTQSPSKGEPGVPSLADSYTRPVLIFLYILIVFLGTAGNATVVWTACFRLPPTVTSVWLANLAAADLAFSLSRVPSLLRELVYRHWPFGAALCKASGLLKYANMFCSVFLLSAISADRALCVRWPVLARRCRSPAAARLVSAGLWLLAVALGVPYSAHRRAEGGRNNLTKCSMEPREREGLEGAKRALYALRFLCGFLLPFLVILGCYSAAALGLRRTRLARRSRPLRILVCLVTAFFLCWAPYHCLLLVKLVNGKSPAVKAGLTLAKGLAYFNSCINPVLYFFMGLDHRRRLRQDFFGACRRALEEDGEGPKGPAGDRGQGQSLVPSTPAGALTEPLGLASTTV
ncbi:chemerin-like receptor 1 [Anguilla rostrata]|uniref:chemerin-like receptor 1 n=1 Tax=Anguilla rostrata TaxID=7938 RepID=UPI0030CD020B